MAWRSLANTLFAKWPWMAKVVGGGGGSGFGRQSERGNLRSKLKLQISGLTFVGRILKATQQNPLTRTAFLSNLIKYFP